MDVDVLLLIHHLILDQVRDPKQIKHQLKVERLQYKCILYCITVLSSTDSTSVMPLHSKGQSMAEELLKVVFSLCPQIFNKSIRLRILSAFIAMKYIIFKFLCVFVTQVTYCDVPYSPELMLLLFSAFSYSLHVCDTSQIHSSLPSQRPPLPMSRGAFGKKPIPINPLSSSAMLSGSVGQRLQELVPVEVLCLAQCLNRRATCGSG